jgi:hypothetical protein
MSQLSSKSTNNSPTPGTTLVPSCARSLSQSLCVGSIGFCLVSTLVFSTVAFGERWLYQHFGVPLAYAFWTLLFIVGGGAIAARLNRGFQSTLRSYTTFALAFVLYAVGWTAAYFTLKTGQRELLGVIAGTLLMSLAFACASGAMRSSVRIFLVLFLTNGAAYFAGRYVWRTLGGQAGMIAWGVLFGLGLGLGLGYALHTCRTSSASEERNSA